VQKQSFAHYLWGESIYRLLGKRFGDRQQGADATPYLPLIFDVLACVPSPFPLGFGAPQRQLDLEASVMTLLLQIT
jgi:hypothetical protein